MYAPNVFTICVERMCLLYVYTWNYLQQPQLFQTSVRTGTIEDSDLPACRLPRYNPARWNSQPTISMNNCYNYASQRQTNTFSLPLHACFEDTCPISIRDMGVFVGNNHPYQKLQSNLPAYILLDRKVSPHPFTSCMCLARATWSVLENLLLLRTNIPDNGILSAVSTVGCTHCL